MVVLPRHRVVTARPPGGLAILEHDAVHEPVAAHQVGIDRAGHAPGIPNGIDNGLGAMCRIPADEDVRDDRLRSAAARGQAVLQGLAQYRVKRVQGAALTGGEQDRLRVLQPGVRAVASCGEFNLGHMTGPLKAARLRVHGQGDALFPQAFEFLPGAAHLILAASIDQVHAFRPEIVRRLGAVDGGEAPADHDNGVPNGRRGIRVDIPDEIESVMDPLQAVAA